MMPPFNLPPLPPPPPPGCGGGLPNPYLPPWNPFFNRFPGLIPPGLMMMPGPQPIAPPLLPPTIVDPVTGAQVRPPSTSLIDDGVEDAPQVELDQRELWDHFYNIGTEMGKAIYHLVSIFSLQSLL